MESGIPILHAWAVDNSRKRIITSLERLHFGIAFDPGFALRRYQESKIDGIFNSDKRCSLSILNSGLPKGALFND